MIEAKLGKLDDAEVTLTTGYDDAVKIQKGELDANAAFMQGKVKVTGNMAKVMSLLPDHELARVQAAPGRDRGDNRVLSTSGPWRGLCSRRQAKRSRRLQSPDLIRSRMGR